MAIFGASNVSYLQCHTLSSLLPGKVTYPGSGAFASSISSYWFVGSRLEPSCIVTPSNAADVSIIIQALAELYHHDSNATFAIRGGGHSANPGAADITQGVTIDMRSINSIQVTSNGSVTSVGGGALWSDVYAELLPRNLTVVGGRVAGVGLGGLTTGGGISAFSPEKGFACDNVINMEVVLANGSTVNANSTSNIDLFAALKGGTNNFGVVTRFDLQSFSQGDFWGGVIDYPQSADAQQLAAFATFKDPENFDPHAEIETAFLYLSNGDEFLSNNNMYYTKPVVNPPALQPFSKIQPQLVNTMKISNISYFAEGLESQQPVNQQGIYATTTFQSTASLLTKVHSLWNASVPQVAKVANLTYTLVFQGFPSVTTENIMGIDPAIEPEKTLVVCLLANLWPDESDYETVSTATQNLLAAIENAAKDEGLYHEYQYLNYAASWQSPLKSYGNNNLEMLKAISRKYDPTGLFQIGVPGGFKLW
ncbi:hypothetical protein NHQ30_010674 [Ciborinia camelliae]|nr:hypothetical protein NHQ30_010674 [Ciborinia camelliae]